MYCTDRKWIKDPDKKLIFDDVTSVWIEKANSTKIELTKLILNFECTDRKWIKDHDKKLIPVFDFCLNRES